MRILTIDLGTSATKAALWSEDGPIAMGRAPVDVEHPRPGWAEQDPESWWTSTVAACRQLPPDELSQVDAVGFSTQRDTFVPVTTSGEPIGRAIAAADRRATEEVAGLGKDFHVLTGVVPDAGTVAAKVAWIRRHEPDRLSGGQRWILGSERPDGVPADGARDHRHFRGVTDRLDRPRRGRSRGCGAPSGDRRIDDDRRQRAPRGIGRSRREGRNARRRGRGRSSLRAARRRRHDGPAHGVLGIGRRRVGAGRACPGAGSRHRRFPRSDRRLRDGGRPSLGGLGARVARPAHGSSAPTSSRSKRTTSTPAPAGSSRSPGWAGLARPGGKPAPVSRSSD